MEGMLIPGVMIGMAVIGFIMMSRMLGGSK
jgi:hypothetical protein